jgi:hypothetical protein
VSAIGSVVLSAACAAGTPSTPSPPPDPHQQVTPTSDASGPIRISFLSASVPPGSTIGGCGSTMSGCEGKLRLTLQLAPAFDGPVLYVRVYLHSQRNGVACLWGEAPGFTVAAGRTQTVDVPIDRSDSFCAPSETLVSMDGIVEGPVQVASRQVWTLYYVFTP